MGRPAKREGKVTHTTTVPVRVVLDKPYDKDDSFVLDPSNQRALEKTHEGAETLDGNMVAIVFQVERDSNSPKAGKLKYALTHRRVKKDAQVLFEDQPFNQLFTQSEPPAVRAGTLHTQTVNVPAKPKDPVLVSERVLYHKLQVADPTKGAKK